MVQLRQSMTSNTFVGSRTAGAGLRIFENLLGTWEMRFGTDYALPRNRFVTGPVTGARGIDLLLVRGGGAANRFVTGYALRGAQICSRRHVTD